MPAKNSSIGHLLTNWLTAIADWPKGHGTFENEKDQNYDKDSGGNDNENYDKYYSDRNHNRKHDNHYENATEKCDTEHHFNILR